MVCLILVVGREGREQDWPVEGENTSTLISASLPLPPDRRMAGMGRIYHDYSGHSIHLPSSAGAVWLLSKELPWTQYREKTTRRTSLAIIISILGNNLSEHMFSYFFKKFTSKQNYL